MTSPDDPGCLAATRARILDQLTERLHAAEAGAQELRRLLAAGDAEAIEAATARIQNVTLEFKLLAEEYRRLPPGDPEQATVARARAGLDRAATRLARSAAISGGTLERLAGLHRGLLALLSEAAGQTYLHSGRPAELRAEGLRIRESA
jgi:hypothetical protein